MNKRAVRAGFSIVEVLVAIAIFGIILIISSSAVTNSLRMTRSAQLDAQAQAFAKSYLDTIKASWAADSLYKTDQLPTALANTVPYPPPVGYDYTATVYSFDPSGGAATQLKQYSYVAGTVPAPNTKPALPILIKTIKLDVKHVNSNRISSFSVRVAFSGNAAW